MASSIATSDGGQGAGNTQISFDETVSVSDCRKGERDDGIGLEFGTVGVKDWGHSSNAARPVPDSSMREIVLV